MPAQLSETEELRRRTLLLRKIVEVLVGELSTLSHRQWADLPELKRRKVVLACRFQEFDWTSDPVTPEPFDLTMLKSLVMNLESHSRQKIQDQLDLIENQILALQELHQYWRECLNVSFQKAGAPT